MAAAAVVVDIGTSTVRIGRSQDARPVYYREDDVLGQSGVWDSSTGNVDHYCKLIEASGLLSSSLLISESPVEVDSFGFKSKVCEIMFEHHQQIDKISFQFAPVLTTFATARQSALVLDMSAGGCTASAVVDGWLLRTNRARSDLGFARLDAWLHNDPAAVSSLPPNYARLEQYRRDRRRSVEAREFVLPDETKVQQALFEGIDDSSSFVEDFIPLPELLLLAATRNQLGNEQRKTLLYNIVPCGGLFLHDVVAPRLLAEVRQLFAGDASRLVCGAEDNRAITSWLGGSIVASLPIFEKEMCVSRAEFAEHGLGVLSKRFA